MERTGESVNSVQLFAYILIIFTIVLIFKRFNWEEMFQQNINPVHQVETTQEISFQEVFNPFHVALSNQNRSSITEGLNLELTLLKPSFVRLFWGADIEEFYSEIQHSWDVLHNRIQEGSFLGQKKMEVTSYSEKAQVCENSLWHLTVPDKIAQVIEAPPRKTYPAVVACILKEPLSDDKQIVLMLSVLHIRDQPLKLDSQILFQFLVTNENKVSTLQPFYVSTENSSSETEGRQYYRHSQLEHFNHDSSNGSDTNHTAKSGKSCATISTDNSGNVDITINTNNSGNTTATADTDNSGISDVPVSADISGDTETCAIGDTRSFTEGSSGELLNGRVDGDNCCVCQDAEMTVVLLPCRHGCVCDQCVLRLDKCPVCRDNFSSYFRIKELRSLPQEPQLEHDNNPVLADNWWERLNNRLNNYFGFT